MTMHSASHDDPVPVTIPPKGLKALLGVPGSVKGIVIFAHGSGSGRLSPRNNYVARGLRNAGLATLLIDLLTPAEEQVRTNVFDIPLLASRLVTAVDWVKGEPDLAALPIGYFGASTGAGAALLAASDADGRIAAIVSRGGRPDLAGAEALSQVRAPTLLLVGSRDVPVIEFNQIAQRHLHADSKLVIIPGATHLFEEPGTLNHVIDHAAHWFVAHFDQVI